MSLQIIGGIALLWFTCTSHPSACVSTSSASNSSVSVQACPFWHVTVTGKRQLPLRRPSTWQWRVVDISLLSAGCLFFAPACLLFSLCHSVSPSCHFLLRRWFTLPRIQSYTRRRTHSLSSAIAIPERNRLVWQWVVYVHEPGDTPATAALICSSQRQVGMAVPERKKKMFEWTKCMYNNTCDRTLLSELQTGVSRRQLAEVSVDCPHLPSPLCLS